MAWKEIQESSLEVPERVMGMVEGQLTRDSCDSEAGWEAAT